MMRRTTGIPRGRRPSGSLLPLRAALAVALGTLAALGGARGAHAGAPEAFFLRGDVSGDGDIDIADPIATLAYLFGGAPLACLDAADTNDDGTVDIADPIGLLAYQFSGGPPPGAPFPACGLDSSDDSLGCAMPSCPQPPCLVEYALADTTYTQGTPIAPNVPTAGCGAVDSWSIDPPLPSGLAIDPATGTISGTPLDVAPSTEHVVTATNAAGSATAILTIEVLVAAPCDLVYPETSPTYFVGVPIAPNVPTVGCGAPDAYEAFLLPDGLEIDPATGAITGTPTQAVGPEFVIVEASNVSGSTGALLTITVVLPAPCSVDYPEPAPTYFVAIPIEPNAPAIGCGTPDLVAIDPPLPSGLVLDPATGTISGTPLAPAPPTLHTVTASNATGSADGTVTIAVEILPAPCGLAYAETSVVYTWSSEIAPNVGTIGCGPPSAWESVPPLPAGLRIDPVTGTISGIPLVLSPPTLHTISASNVTGETSAAVTIEVVDAVPTTLPGGTVVAGPAMSSPRYGHSATALDDGTILVIGGTDEIFLSAFATAEIHVPGATPPPGAPTPGTITGDFIDQDIDGNPIALAHGGRFFHTATLLDDGTLLVIGGTDHIFFGEPNDRSEIFDPATRTFTEPALQIAPADDIDEPRTRHSATRLPDGRVLVAGGQEFRTVNVPRGFPGVTITIPAHASTETLEIFDPATLSFSEAVDTQGFAAVLTTPRGRAAHTTATFAGFDGALGSGDDAIGFIGGYMTLSAISLAAPQDLYPWNFGTTKLSSMDFYDPISGTVNLAMGLQLSPRVNHPIAVNLGADHPSTPSGDPGVANAVLILGGDGDAPCPEGAPQVGSGTTDHAELLIATFTGFGPSNGIRFTAIPGATMTNDLVAPAVSSSPHANGHEIAIAGCGEFQRSFTQAVLLDATRTYGTFTGPSSIVVTAGGAEVEDLLTCEISIEGPCPGALRGFEFFDPFYDIAANATLLSQLGPANPAPWDLAGNVTTLNPLGLRGTWLRFDGAIPSDSTVGYADGSPALSLAAGRLLHTLTRSVGADGTLGTLDDRVVVIGGTDEYWPTFGGDPVPLSCEVFVPPDGGP